MIEKARYEDLERGIAVEAFTDGYVYDEHGHAYLLSAAGRESSVKAISSAIISGLEVEVMSKPAIAIRKRYGESYRVMSGRLPSGILQQLVVSERFFDGHEYGEELIYVPSGEQPATVVYHTVRGSYPVPLIPEWSAWLYERLVEEGGLRELLGTHRVLGLTTDEEMLDALVSEGVQEGEIIV